MGRRAAEYLPMPDGSMLGIGFKLRDGIIRCRFVGPDGKPLELSTGVYAPRKWRPGQPVPVDVLQEAAKLVVRAYAPTLPSDPRKVRWDDAMQKLSAAAIRPKTLETYRTAVANLRAALPDVPGPAHVTPELASEFARVFAAGSFKRGKAEAAATYRRSPQTVFNAVANLSIVWGHFRDLGVVKGPNPWESVRRPKLPKRVPRIPDEGTLGTFFGWLDARYPGWELMRLFVTVKMLTGRRLNDLCQLRSDQLRGETLTVRPDQDKTNRELAFPLPADVAADLHRLKGPTFLWERYATDSATYRAGPARAEVFTPTVLYNAVKSIFRSYNRAHPGAKLRTHDLRKRALTLAVLTSGNADQTAQAFGIDPQTARRFYIDAAKAHNAGELLRKVASVLLPPGDSGTVVGRSEGSET